MTLLDATPYDPGPARRRRIKILTAVLILVVLGIVGWMNRYWSEERIVGKFFAALQSKDYETAYAIYFADPRWKQHPAKYSRYPLDQFTQDWGPGGQWGAINKYKVNGASGCSGGGSGIVVDVVVNDRTQHAQLYVSKEDKSLGYVPCDIEVH